jgi:uncharacterized protein YraI
MLLKFSGEGGTMMRQARVFLGGALALLALSTGALAKPAYVASTVNLRAAPGSTSEIVDKIPGGSLVDASECTEGWCAVTWQNKAGFAIESALDMSGRVPTPRRTAVRRPAYGPTYYDEGPVYYAPPPVYARPYPYYYGRPYYYGHRWRHRW